MNDVDEGDSLIIVLMFGQVGGLYSNMRSPVDFFRQNMAINDNVLSMAYEFKVEKCVAILSTCIFPDKIKYPIDETMVTKCLD